ncbi:menaquinone biosynthesis protein [Granulicella sp. WH15]|uniref:menaquinone biosynthetic enzyme MqnA/MqnD family protein n=1 Tax=Granulicella sp. WH15 TaxID=2602070 RepID=UPI0021036493|nr:menaquinone biosynthesis protein [Granulicella sp. WH15]
MPSENQAPLRVAAISFLNPAPLMYSFEHTQQLAGRYTLEYMVPSQCAANLLAGRADLGLIPIAALTPELAIVPGCVIASLDHVRSILLIVKAPHTLATVKTMAADTASRSSVAYSQVLFRHFFGTDPAVIPTPADVAAMLAQADSALVIGDAALLALENREVIESAVGPCTWLDVAHEWRSLTGLPWVAAVWAVRPEAVADPARLVADLNRSRELGMEHIDAIVEAWTPRIALSATSIRSYLTENIHYTLDDECAQAIQLFRRLAAETGTLPELPQLRFL